MNRRPDMPATITYTEEEPNALAPEEVGPFLAAMRDRHPQHLGMVESALFKLPRRSVAR